MRRPSISVPPRSVLARRATLRRAVGLLTAFRFEQSDPGKFYYPLAVDTVELVAATRADSLAIPPADALQGVRVIDVGGGPGFFESAFAAAGAWYASVEIDATEIAAQSLTQRRVIQADGRRLPLPDDSCDVVLCSNVAEHIPDPWVLLAELLRVTRPGGVVIFSYTVWFGPFGGHEMGLTHYLGGHRAARMYTRKHGRAPKNLFGTSLFRLDAETGMAYAEQLRAQGYAVRTYPRYHPWWAWWVRCVPGLREVATANLVLSVTVPAASPVPPIPPREVH